MRRLLAVGLSSIILASFLVTSGPELRAEAAIAPVTLNLDCTDTDSLNASLAAELGAKYATGMADYALTGASGSSITIVPTNSSWCVVQDGDTGGSNGAIVVTGGATKNFASSETFSVDERGYFRVGAGGNIAGGSTTTEVIGVAPCSLEGEGTSAAPWLVGTQAHFQKVGSWNPGVERCSPDGHYLQTDDLTSAHSSGTSNILDDYTDDQVAEAFSGTYDGDHYSIELGGTGTGGWRYDSNGDAAGGFATRSALFADVNGGTIKRVRIGGNIKTDSDLVGGLVGRLRGGGVISEVAASLAIESSDVSPILGGMVGRSSGASRVQYSYSTSVISWPGTATPGDVSIGGIIGEIQGAGDEVRDSYFAGEISIDSEGFYDANYDVTPSSSIYLGGIVGRQTADGKFVRTYSVGSASDSCANDPAPATPVCAPDLRDDDNLFAGGLSGNVRAGSVFVSNFFLQAGLFRSAVGVGTAPVAYNVSDEPVAVPLSASRLKQIATYQSLEGGTAGSPSGSADLGGDSDFRWAIEEISVATFVPSSYDTSTPVVDEGTSADIATYTNRVLYPDTSVAREYPKLRGGDISSDLSGHNAAGRGDIDPASVVGYPALGRVWDICDDYPSLVWEEVNSCGGGGGGSSSPSTSDLALAAGLTEAEYLAFLASGLTLEQFKAARLAATGPNGALLVGGGSLALLFLAAGAAILGALRRERRLGRL